MFNLFKRKPKVNLKYKIEIVDNLITNCFELNVFYLNSFYGSNIHLRFYKILMFLNLQPQKWIFKYSNVQSKNWICPEIARNKITNEGYFLREVENIL